MAIAAAAAAPVASAALPRGAGGSAAGCAPGSAGGGGTASREPAACPPLPRGEDPGRSRLLLGGLPALFLPFFSLFSRSCPHTPPSPPPPPHAPFPKHPGSPRAAPPLQPRGSGGIQTPLHNITTTARRDWPPRGGEARVSRVLIGHAAAALAGARPRLPETERGRRRGRGGGNCEEWARIAGARGAGRGRERSRRRGDQVLLGARPERGGRSPRLEVWGWGLQKELDNAPPSHPACTWR